MASSLPSAAPTSTPPAWHEGRPDEVASRLATGVHGLTREEARGRFAHEGPNQLPEEPPTRRLVVLLHQFRSPLIYLLLAATLVTVAFREFIDAGVIAAVLVLDAVIGYTQERRAEASVRALARLLAPRARVIRDGREWEIESRELVPGDLVLLESGVRVPADLRLLSTTALRVDESLLTGESLPVTKTIDTLHPADRPLADRLFGEKSRTYRATLIGRDPLSDSALIRLQRAPANLPVATLGDSDALEPGDWVMAIGNPFQLGHTVTVGVVSNRGRPFQVEDGRWQKMIQTDASINPGNSGGPLINVRGQVVGINAAILGGATGGNIGIGFAVPINSVMALLPQLHKGKVVRGRIGVQLRGGTMTDEDARALGLSKAGGAIVTAVERDSPADRAGLQAGDVIVAFNGTPVASADDLVPRVSSTPPGSRVTLTVMREGRERAVQVTVEELALENERGAVRQPAGAAGAGFGLRLGDVTASIARQLGLSTGMDGAVVYDVADDSPADRSGLQQGDVLRSVNRHTVRNAADAVREFQRIEPEASIFVLIWRGGNEMLVRMQRE